MSKIKQHEALILALVSSGQLEIDEGGRIWRVAMTLGKRDGSTHVVPVKRRRAERKTPAGCLQVRAMIGGKRIHCGAHRLVWVFFNGGIPDGHEINHQNGMKDDNRPANLQCSTVSENVRHAHANGLRDQHGQKNPAHILTDNEVAQIRLAYSRGGYTQKELAGRFGITHQHVSKIVRAQRRPKQGGPVNAQDHRHVASDRDAETGRFVVAGRLLDGREWNEAPA